MRCIRRTIRDCRPYRSSHAVCQFCRSGSSGIVGRLLRLRLSNREPVPAVRSYLDRCRYRYICRTGGFSARDDCRPRRSGVGFRGRSRLNHAGMTFLKNRNRVCTAHTLHRDWRFCAGYGLLNKFIEYSN